MTTTRASGHRVSGERGLFFATDGAERLEGVALPDLAPLREALASLPQDRPGLRLQGITALNGLLAANGVIGAIVNRHLGAACQPVRAVLFDKTEGANWALGWHQDRTICVDRRVAAAGFGRWSTKQGLQHVEPPFALLARMVTVRVHLDDVGMDNAPLLVAPGSHHFGKVLEEDIPPVVARCGTTPCLAEAGDVWLYATPILHASPAAAQPSRRRVLQIDFSADALPGGLRWLGI